MTYYRTQGTIFQEADILVNSAEIFDVTTKGWTVTASMAQERYGHAMVTLQDGSVLAMGGGVLPGIC